MMKKYPVYRKALKQAAAAATEDMEKVFQKKWQEDDETLNLGERDYDAESNENDEIYNIC